MSTTVRVEFGARLRVVQAEIELLSLRPIRLTDIEVRRDDVQIRSERMLRILFEEELRIRDGFRVVGLAELDEHALIEGLRNVGGFWISFNQNV